MANIQYTAEQLVSTHSRPKAAAFVARIVLIAYRFQHTAARRRLGYNATVNIPINDFNTQPPEGG